MKNLLLAASIAMSAVSAQANMTQINFCGFVITEPGHYELANSLICANDPTKPAITVKNTKHVTIHMKNRSISFFIKKLPIKIFPPKFEPKKAIGILASDSRDVEIKGDGQLSSIMKAAVGVMARNTEDLKTEDLALNQNNVGVSFQGPQSDDGRVKETTFQQNTCDVQVKLGAENPQLHDSNAQSFCQ